MLIALYRPGDMVIGITIKLVTFVNIRVQLEKKNLPYFYDLAKSIRPRPLPTPSPRNPRAGLGKTKKLAPSEGGKAHHGGDVCVVFCVLINILTPI
jgi:hypothetical protein